MNLTGYQVPRVLVTCRSKLKLLKLVKEKISGTKREALFRQSCFDWVLDQNDWTENCILIHFMLGQQLEIEGDGNEIVLLYYYITDNITIQFGREGFCLVTGLRFGVENLGDYNDSKLPIPFRRWVFPSCLDGEHITGNMVLRIIDDELFDRLHDDDPVSLCCVDILPLVLLGVEGKCRIPEWMLGLANDREKEEPPQDSNIRKLIREECCVKVCEEQKQSMEDTMLELVKICRQKELLCMHDNVDDLIESALNTKLLSINSQRLEKEQQEVKNVVEQRAKCGNRIEKSLQNFRVIHKSSISFKNTSQISSIHAVATILSNKEPEYSPGMGYEHPNTTPETKSDEIIKSGVEELVSILSENEVTLEDKRECDVLVFEDSSASDVCDDHSKIFSDSKDNDDISVYDDFEDVEYVEVSLSDPEIVNVEEENDVNQEEEEIDLEDISQIQDVDLREKLLSITRLIANIESLNDNPIPNCELNSFVSIPIFEESDNSLSNNFSPEFETFCDHTEETRSGNTTHADNSLPEYDSFCFEIEPDQERLINVIKNGISNDSSSNPLLEEVDLFLNSILPGIENFADNSEGDIRFLEELLIDDFILSHESSDSNFEDNPSVLRPPPKPPDAEFDAGKEIPVVMNDKDKFDEEYYFFMFDKVFSLLFAESEDTIFDPRFAPHRLKFSCVEYLSQFARSSHPFLEISLRKSISFDQYCLAVICRLYA
nr:hypothetical protein [Tanacetum cinerariifolium]